MQGDFSAFPPFHDMSTRFRLRVVLTAFSLVACGCAPFLSPARAFTPAPLFPVSQVSLRVLPNGVRSIVKETPGSGIVAVQVWVRAGSRHQLGDQGGAAHLLGIVCMNASRDNSLQSGGATSAIRALGGNVFSQTTRDATNFGATVASPFAPNAIRVLADAVLRPDLSGEALASAKNLAQNEVAARESDALSVASDLSYSASFKTHPYRRSPLGQSGELNALGVAKLRAFAAERYSGANISVVVVGEISTERAHQLIAQSFADAPRAKPNARTQFGSSEAATNQPISIRRTGSVARPAVALSFRAPSIDTPIDVVAMDVLISHWNEGRDAAMRRELIGNDDESSTGTDETAPPALALDIAFLTQRNPSLVTFSLVTEANGGARAVRTLYGEIARVQKNGVTDRELERAKRALRRQYVTQDETVAGQAGALGFYDMIDSYEFATTYANRINQVTLADIRRVANRYFALSAPVAILIQPAPTPKAPQNDGGVDA